QSPGLLRPGPSSSPRQGECLVFALPPKPPLSDQHITERLKLAASGCQSLALALFGAGVISPLFAALNTPWYYRLAAFFAASISERAALELLRYLPNAKPSMKEQINE
ncbi:hypothetical protein, partial [Acetobacter malorum]|uniref:hypothetical protein n=1 Tax=Acetobacter malorum TaxID=178901 RepID=UPI000A3FB1A6